MIKIVHAKKIKGKKKKKKFSTDGHYLMSVIHINPLTTSVPVI